MSNQLIRIYKDKNRLPFWEIWVGLWIGSFVSIVCNLINILTFCFWRPLWDVKLFVFSQEKQAKFKFKKVLEQMAEMEQKIEKKIQSHEKELLNSLEKGEDKTTVGKNVFS